MKDLKLMMVFGWLQFLIIWGSGYIAKSMPDDECPEYENARRYYAFKERNETDNETLDLYWIIK